MTASTCAALTSLSWPESFRSRARRRWRARAVHCRTRSDCPDEPLDGALVESNHE
jgi:hypothetical protein